jgi:hypothetical protein
MSEPVGPCAIYSRGVEYSDEVFFVDPDPILDAALRTWRASGDPNEVLSLLQHQNEHSESPDHLVSVHPTFAEAQAVFPDVLNNILRSLTFIDFGFAYYGIRSIQSARRYSTERDSEKWEELFDSPESGAEADDDVPYLLAWCDQHEVTHPSARSDRQLEEISARRMEPDWDGEIDDQADVFLADILVEQLRAEHRHDLIVDLWSTLVGQLAFIGPAPSDKPVEFDLRRMSIFRERNIDTSGFTATSLGGNELDQEARTLAAVQSIQRIGESLKNDLFGRIFGK